MAKKKKKMVVDPSRLDQSQVEFIYNKVRELGSVEAVDRFYKERSSVTAFARLCAKMMYGGEK